MKRTIRQSCSLVLAMVMMLFMAAWAEADSVDGNTSAETICSDIVAGIDPDSIVTDGDTTFFSSIMSNGASVRFEGANIVISEDGITLKPESTLISLDAIGQIHTYFTTVKDGADALISEQWLDIGYGYMDSADKISVERANDLFAGSLMGYPVSAWNEGAGLSIAEFAPNFAFVMGASGNTAAFTLTSLTIEYDPSELFTNIEVAKQVLPGYFDSFDSFFTTAATVEEDIPAESPEDYSETIWAEADVPVAEPIEYSEGELVESELSDLRMAESGAITSDIVSGIDRSTIVTDGSITRFSSVMGDGAVVWFEGENITITDEGIVFSNTSSLLSLDALGKVYTCQLSIKDGEQAPTCDQWLCVDYGYTLEAEKTSIEHSDELRMLSGAAQSAKEWNLFPAFTAFSEPNFLQVFALGANTADVTLTSLTIGYQPTEKNTALEEIRTAVPDNFLLGYIPSDDDENMMAAANGNALMSEDGQIALRQPAEETTAENYAQKKLAEAGVLHSDVVAGIDQSSITASGTTTFFSSVMDDGTVVRFEGENIAVTDEGIVMKAGSRVTSLDAVGKIYEYSADIKDKSTSPISDQWLGVNYAYTFSAEKTSVDRASNVHTYSISALPASVWAPDTNLDVAIYSPNFVSFQAESYNAEAFTLTSLIIGYNPNEKVTAITSAQLNASNYGYYVDGELYAKLREDKANADEKEYDFYLVVKPETQDEIGADDTSSWLHFLPKDFYTVGDLKDADGNVLDKKTARVHAGSTLDVTIGDYTLTVELPMADLYTNAQTLKDARPYSTLSAVGQQNALVVPVVWADQTNLVSDDVYALYQKALGNLLDEHGNAIGDFSDANDEVFSLSEYFNTASYGQLTISSFMTDWYYTDKTFAGDYEYIFPEIEFADEVLQWVKANYPDMDWSKFDQDGDGVVDAIVLFSVGLSEDEGYMPASFGGAVQSTGNQFGKRAGTAENPQANCFLTVNHSFVKDGKTNTLIHEFSHLFGLNDYYDGSGNGVNAVGGYDMEGSSVGDWNAYSKLAVGWMNPQVVTGLASGESIDLTIGSSALTGDVIVLPAAGMEYTGPFSEYVMIDLLTPDGANAYDASEYELEDTVGVRISHVDANMKRTTESDGAIGLANDNGNVIGMELYTNNYDDERGFYNIEVIQASRKNTFTVLDEMYTCLRPTDLFYAGDTFSAETYDKFFYQGLMDNGMPLGYTVKILSIGTDAEGQPTATVRITAN